MKIIHLTTEEASELHALLDIAVKTMGLKVAGNAAFLDHKIQSSPDAETPQPKLTEGKNHEPD